MKGTHVVRVKSLLPTIILVVTLTLWSAGNSRGTLAATQAEIDLAVSRAAEYLREPASKASGGRQALAAYALYKAGRPETDEEISKAIQAILRRFNNGVYKPGSQSEAPYQAGVEAMFLAELDAVKYRPQL
ncbi:MAG: hypothetical protein KF861_03810, partial [Planctomycetaceae bacterium]|nr:hypothetical protein [Planctomycetaceae bacterium]